MGRLTNVTNMAPTPGFDAGLGGADGAGEAFLVYAHRGVLVAGLLSLDISVPHAYRLLEISIGIPRSGPIHWACVIAFCIATVHIASSKVFSSMFAKLADLIWGLLKGSGT